MSDRTCTETDCDKPVTARNLCRPHYMKAWRDNDPRVAGPKPPKEKCDAPDCDELRTGRQLYCNTHYQRVRRNGDLEVRTPGPAGATGATTAVCSRCNKSFKASAKQRERADSGKAVYCSRDCQKGDNMVVLECAGCGSDVQRRKSDVKGERVFCSAECRNGTGRPRTGRTIACETCGTDVWVRKSEEGTKRYCSHECSKKGQERREDRTCGNCQGTFRVPLSSEARYCSMDCFHEARRAKVGDRWVNPKTGYAWIWVDGGDGQAVKVQEHRYVMEQHIGRPLFTWETVHHMTGGIPGRSNNDLSNLELWATRHPYGHRVEDIVAYCREMLALYGTPEEQERYAWQATRITNDQT